MQWEYLKEEDLPLWMVLSNMVQDFFPGYEEESHYAYIRAAQKRKEAIIVKDQGCLLGALSFSKQEKELCYMVVHPQHRRCHIGQILFHGMCQSFYHGDQIQVVTFPSNNMKGMAARHFYSSIGFQEGPSIELYKQPLQILTYTISKQDDTLILPCTNRSFLVINQLCALWEASVRATHTFLNDDDIVQIRGDIPSALSNIPYLYTILDPHQDIIGFMGIDYQEIAMLFLHPDKCGQGIGQTCITYAIHHHQCNCVNVNEQNSAARIFYEKMGFLIKEVSPVDDAGRPFPILHLKLEQLI